MALRREILAAFKEEEAGYLRKAGNSRAYHKVFSPCVFALVWTRRGCTSI